MVRELHVYGTAVAVHARDASKFQHQVGGQGLWLGGCAARVAALARNAASRSLGSCVRRPWCKRVAQPLNQLPRPPPMHPSTGLRHAADAGG